jgi:hypothetical protein
MSHGYTIIWILSTTEYEKERPAWIPTPLPYGLPSPVTAVRPDTIGDFPRGCGEYDGWESAGRVWLGPAFFISAQRGSPWLHRRPGRPH